MSWRARTFTLAAAFVLAMAALTPLRLLVEQAGLSARGVSGSVWSGRIEEARLGELGLGSANVALSPRSLFALQPWLKLAGDRIEGTAWIGGGEARLERVAARLDLAGAAQLPLAGVETSGLTVIWQGGRCALASGFVSANLAPGLEEAGLPARFTGTARCDEEALLLPLASASGAETLHVRLRADGSYEARLAARPADEATRLRLAATGFAPARQGFAARFHGRF